MLNQITKTYKGLPKIEAISSFCLVLRSESKRKVFLVYLYSVLYVFFQGNGQGFVPLAARMRLHLGRPSQ